MMLALDVVLVAGAAFLARKAIGWFGQPPVIGELAVGIVLGPTVLGPALSETLFPPDVRPGLRLVGQLGLIAFMFLVGLELERPPRGRAVALVAGGAAFVPFAAGLLLAPALFAAFPPPDATKPAFALFVGISLAITAFPVLARILRERGMDHTPLGALALAAAALNDTLGWSLLAVVLAVATASSLWSGPLALGITALLAAGLWTLARPGLAWLQVRHPRVLPWLAPPGMIVCALVTDAAGAHVIFGAFLLGVVWPRGSGDPLPRWFERPMLLLALPAFFVLPGLSLDLRAFDAGSAAVFALVLAVAVGAKVAGAAGGARLAGLGLRDAVLVGVLMNTRGLMELIVLNLGFELGVLNVELYTLLVLMAIVTTLMTDPLLRRAIRRGAARVPAPAAAAALPARPPQPPPAGD